MEERQMSLSELAYKIESGGEVENYLAVYPLDEWKKLAVCNFLVRMRSNGSSTEHSRLDDKGGRNWSGRF